MAASGQPQPPDLGGSLRAPLLSNGCWPPLKATVSPPAENKAIPARSFVEITKAQNECVFPAIQLASRKYGTKDGKPAIQFTTSELQVGVDHLKHALVAKFSGGRPTISEVRQSFLQAWTPSGRCSIGALDAKHILIVLDTEVDARKILVHPIRKLGHSPFRLFRWSKDFNTKREPTSTTAWIRLAALPPELTNPGYIESIVASFGKFLAVDNRTRAFINPNYARVCMELDMSRELPDVVWIATGPSTGFWQKVIYENRLSYCTKCRLHGHELSNCRKLKQRQVEEQRIWAERDDHGLPIIGHPTIAASQKDVQPITNPSETQQKATIGQDWTVVQKRRRNKKQVQQGHLDMQPIINRVEKGTTAMPKGQQHVGVVAPLFDTFQCIGEAAKKDNGDTPLLHKIVPVVAPKDNKKQRTSDVEASDVDRSLALSVESKAGPLPSSTTPQITNNDSIDVGNKDFSKPTTMKEKQKQRISLGFSPTAPQGMEKQRTSEGKAKDRGLNLGSSPSTLDTSNLKEKQRTSGPSNTTVVLKEKVTSSLNVRAAPFLPGHVSDTDLSDEEWIPARKVKQMRKMEKQAKRDKLEEKKNSYDSLIPDLILTKEDKTRSQPSSSSMQNISTLAPLPMYSRTRVLDNEIGNADPSHECRRSNPYID